MSGVRLRAALALGAALAGGLVLGRAATRVYLAHWLRERPLPITLHRELAHLPGLLAQALVVAALVALLCAWRAASPRRPGADLAAVGASALLVVALLAGWPLDGVASAPSLATARGLAFVGASLALGALAGAALLAILRAAPRRAAGRGALAAGLALLAAPLVALYAVERAVNGRARLREVVAELAFEPERWEVVERHPRLPAASSVLCPVPDWRYDGGDLPGLLMPPPCRVAFEVREEDGPVALRAAAGIDDEGYQRMPPGDPPLTVRFEVRVNGSRVFEHEVELTHEAPPEARVWRRFEGVALRPGDRVELSTDLAAPGYETPAQVPGLPAGFGGVVLERTQTRGRSRATPETPNVVLVVMDTLRQDRLSCYGHPGGTTPHLDALAARGILYEHAYSTASWTWPSTASLLTGLAPESHGVEADESCYLQSRLESLPELLAARSFATGAFSCNPLIVPDKGFDQGFERFDSLHGFRRSETMIERPLEWIDLHASHRFFLYVHLVDPHAPYVPIDEFLDPILPQRPADFPEDGVAVFHPRLLRGEGHDPDGTRRSERVVPPEHLRWLDTVYDATVQTADHFVGELLAKLAEHGLEDRTIVAFTSDHGEEFLDHGLVTHGNTLHRELVRVPMIVAGPGLASGERVPTPVSNRHLAPTLAKFGNARFTQIPDPLDLTKLAELPRAPVFFSTHQGWWNGRHRLVIHGVRDGDWELHWAPEGAPWGAAPGSQPGGDLRLYQLDEDPWQQRDLAAERPDKARELKTALEAHLDAARRLRPGSPRLGAGGRSRQMLEAIGYIQPTEESER